MNKPLPHQEKYAHGYKDKALLVHETGTGKTVCACLWLADSRDRDALVVCPKRVVKKWQDTLKTWNTKATVLSKEQFKKEPVRKWSAVVIDEIDEFASPLFNKNRSQLTTSLYSLVKAYPDVPFLGLTATPIRSTPWNMHSLLCFIGVYIDHRKWRDFYFDLFFPGTFGPTTRPWLSRPAYFPKPDWRKKIRGILEKYADIVLLRDCVGEVPSIEEETIDVKAPKFEKNPEWEPSAAFVAEHRHEQTNKPKEILAIGKEYRKVLVVAHYIEQIETLKKELEKDRETFMVHGSVKGQEEILKQAQESDECYLIVQASLGVGWDADTFSCVVFASMSYKVRDFVQIKGRVRRIHNLHPVKYVYLLGGRCDKGIKKMIELGRDFIPSEYMEHETPRPAKGVQEKGGQSRLFGA